MRSILNDHIAPEGDTRLPERQLARNKKRKTFSATKAVKAVAREKIGAVPSTRAVPDRKKKGSTQHKPTMRDLLEDSD